MLVRCVAFAFKEGSPKDNPYWVEDLRDLDGRDPELRNLS